MHYTFVLWRRKVGARFEVSRDLNSPRFGAIMANICLVSTRDTSNYTEADEANFS